MTQKPEPADEGINVPHPNGEAEPGSDFGGKQTSSATNTSFETGAGVGATGYDSPPTGSVNLGNTEVEGPTHAEPYYPPGGGVEPKREDRKERLGE
jgi:hypothetical protein